MTNFDLNRIIYRAWFYFRVGYSTYLALLVGIASNLLLFYKLGIQDIDLLHDWFTSLTLFAITAILILLPVSIGAGLYHMKRTGAYAADAAVSAEQNPYAYKAIPGKEQQVLYPILALTLKGLVKVLEKQPVTEEEKQEFEKALEKTNRLIQGEPVGAS